MENNLDDILVDSTEETQTSQKKPKRMILIAIAFVLLIGVVGLVLFFIFGKKEKPQGLEVNHTELEKLVVPNEESVKKDDEFDKLIAEIKAKHSMEQTPPQGVAQNSTQTQEMPKIQETPKVQEMPKPQEKPKALEKKEEKVAKQDVKVQEKPQAKTASKPKSQEKPKAEAKKSNEPKKQKVEKAQVAPQKQATPKKQTASQAFESLGDVVPKGFYLQVGVFISKPNAEFLEKLINFSYKVEKINQKGKVVNRYLIGPFASRSEAEAKKEEVKAKVTKPVVVEIR